MKMDSQLLGQAIEYHGPDLLRQLTIEEQPFPESVLDHLHRYRPQSPEIKDEDLMNKVRNFIAKKADILFKPVSDDVQFTYNPIEEEDNYGKMPPIETFMGVPSEACRKHFFNGTAWSQVVKLVSGFYCCLLMHLQWFQGQMVDYSIAGFSIQSLEKRDTVIGVVSSIMDSGLIVTLLCLDSGKSRDIDELKFTAFCPAKELPRLFPNQSAIETFQVKDKIRGVVLSVNPETEKINISLLDRALPDDAPKPKLGLISEEEFPVQYKRKLHIRGLTFDELLHSIIGFNNCNSVPYLLERLKQKEEISLMRGLHELKIPEKEYCENIRKIQSQKWAHQNVARGIKYFKAGKYMEAMQELNRALQIDTNNVEALVARGALYANNESYHKAIQDFEDALTVNSNHSNARKYLFETLLAVARGIEERGKDLEEAEYYYKKALSIQPESQEARKSLRFLHAQREKQGHDKRKRSHDSRTSSTPKSHEQREDSPLKKDKDHRGSTPQRRNSNTSHSSIRKYQEHGESTPHKRSSIASHSPEKSEEDFFIPASQADSFLGKTTETLKKLIKEDKKDGKKRKRKSTEDEYLDRRAKKKRHESHGSKSNDSSFEELYKKEETEKQKEWKSGQKLSGFSEDQSGRRKIFPDTQQKCSEMATHDSGLSRRLTFFSTDMQQRGLRIPGLDDSKSDNENDGHESPYHKRSFPEGPQKRSGHSRYENREFEENDRYLESLSPHETGTDARKMYSFDAHSLSSFPKYMKYEHAEMSQEIRTGSGKETYSERSQSEIQSRSYGQRSDGNFKQRVAVDKDRKSRSMETSKTSHRDTQDYNQNKSPAQILLDTFRDKEDDTSLKMQKKESSMREDSIFDSKGMSRSPEIRSSEYTRTIVMFGNVEENNASEASTKTSNRGLFVDIPRQLKKGLKKDTQKSTEKTTADDLAKKGQQVTVEKKYKDDKVMINEPEQASEKSSDQPKRHSVGQEKGDSKVDKDDHYEKEIPQKKKGDRRSRSSDISQRRLSVDQEREGSRTGKDRERSPTRRRDVRRIQSSGRSGSRSSGKPYGRSLRRSHSISGRSCSRSLRRSHSRSSGRSRNRSILRSHSRTSGKSLSRSSKKLHSRSTRRSCSRASEKSHSRSFQRSHSRASWRSQSCSSYSRSSSRSSSGHSKRRHLSPYTSDRSARRSPYHEKYLCHSRFHYQEDRRCDQNTGHRKSPYRDEESRYKGHGRGRGAAYRGGYFARKDYSEWRRKMKLVERFIAKKDAGKRNESSRTENESFSEKKDTSTDFKRLEDKEHQKSRDDSDKFDASFRRNSVEDERYMKDMKKYPIDSSIKDENYFRNESQKEGADKRSPGSLIRETAFGKEDIGEKCVPSDKSDKLSSSDKNAVEDKSVGEIHSLKQPQHDTKFSGQSSPGKESIESNHSSPSRKNVASPGMPLLTVDLKSKWDSPKRKSRWGTPDQYSIGIGLEMPLIFTKARKRGSVSPMVESKSSMSESTTLDKAGKEIDMEGRKEESYTFRSPFKKMSPDHGEANMDEYESDTRGGKAEDNNIKRLSDRGVEDFRGGMCSQPQTGPDLIDDHVPSGSSQKGKSHQRENIIINVRNTGNEVERITTSYIKKDERDGFDGSRCQEKGKMEPFFNTKEDDKYDIRRKREEHYMKERQQNNTGCYDDVSSPKELKCISSERMGLYHKATSSEYLHHSTTSGRMDLPDLVKSTKTLSGTSHSRAQSPGRNRSLSGTDSHVDRRQEISKSLSQSIERTSDTRSRGGAKGVEKRSGSRSFEPYSKRSISRSLSSQREGKIRKSAANEKNKRSQPKQLKHETSLGQKLKTRKRKRSSSSSSGLSSSSSKSSSSSFSASDSPVANKRTFTGKKDTSIRSSLARGKSNTKDNMAQGKPGGRSITETSDESSKKRRESLDDLENFLNQLKEKKKEQWIAEGKIKDKNSEGVT